MIIGSCFHFQIIPNQLTSTLLSYLSIISFLQVYVIHAPFVEHRYFIALIHQ